MRAFCEFLGGKRECLQWMEVSGEWDVMAKQGKGVERDMERGREMVGVGMCMGFELGKGLFITRPLLWAETRLEYSEQRQKAKLAGSRNLILGQDTCSSSPVSLPKMCPSWWSQEAPVPGR